VVSAGVSVVKKHVRDEFSRVKRLAELPPSLRGWTLDVLRVVRQLGRREFTLGNMYAFERELKALHPKNENVRPKIRQQLQVLRDLGLLRFGAKGNYCVA
jgi:type II restriction enzyme